MHCCKFCTLYENLPFRFRMSPLEDIEADLREAQLWACDPLARLSAQLQGLPRPEGPRRVFLVGANPFVLLPQRLYSGALKRSSSIFNSPRVDTVISLSSSRSWDRADMVSQ